MVASAALAALREAKLGSEPMHERGLEPLSRPPLGSTLAHVFVRVWRALGGWLCVWGGACRVFVCVHSCAPSAHVRILCGGVGACVRRNTRKNNCQWCTHVFERTQGCLCVCERAGALTTCSEGPQSRLQEPSLVPEHARKKQQLLNLSKQNNCAVLFACLDHF